MVQVQLKAQKKTISGAAETRRLKKQGRIPAIVYGRGENLPISLEKASLLQLRRNHFSENMIVNLQVEGANEEIHSVIHEYQIHPLTDEVIHIDFLKISLKEKIRVSVPLKLVGEAPGVKEGGLLDQTMFSIHISCLPLDMPEFLTLDISDLHIAHSLHIGDIKFPAGIEAADALTETVVTCTVIKEEAPAADAEATTAQPVTTVQKNAPAAPAAPAKAAPKKK